MMGSRSDRMDTQAAPPRSVGMVLFEGVTQLDLTGPYEVFARMPNTQVHLLAATLAPVRTEWGLTITPTTTFDDASALDVLCVPGGWGVNAQLENAAMLQFLRRQSQHARFVTSVCSGALLIGAAGLLRGYRATTHWMSHDMLLLLGAVPVRERVVVDRDRITGAGVTAGIDLSLVVAATLFGEGVAQSIELAIEYDPAPPFRSGSPDTAPREIRDDVLRASARALSERRAILERVGARLIPQHLFPCI
ncbi:MAG: DJ-1/PfpI family protein [Gemmatimonadaceae bacterium]